jgi:hypothetical protein
VGVTRAGGVDRDDPRGRDMGDLVAARQHAARRPGPDDDPWRAVPPAMIGSARLAEQPTGGFGRVGHAGAGPGLPLVAAPPVAARPHRAQHSRRDLGDQRARVCEQQHAARQAGSPLPQDRARGGRGQPVAGNVDGVTGPCHSARWREEGRLEFPAPWLPGFPAHWSRWGRWWALSRSSALEHGVQVTGPRASPALEHGVQVTGPRASPALEHGVQVTGPRARCCRTSRRVARREVRCGHRPGPGSR